MSPPSLPASNESGYVVAATFPLVPGHVVVTSHRKVRSWFELAPDEQADLLALASQVRSYLLAEGTATSIQVGFHEALAAEPRPVQLHLIPLPAQLSPPDDSSPSWTALHDPRLLTPRDEAFWLTLVQHFETPAYDRIDLVISFVMWSGMQMLTGPLDNAMKRGAKIRLLTSDYMNVTDPEALQSLLDRCDDFDKDTLEVRIFGASQQSFHPKAYLFHDSIGRLAPRAFVGSSNLSRSALVEGVEWNLAVQHFPPVQREFESLWNAPQAKALDIHWLDGYRERRKSVHPDKSSEALLEIEGVIELPPPPPVPTDVQEEALADLARCRREGYRAALVVMATGLGKTYLAAFDSVGYARVLFVAHRGEILRQARDIFRRIRPTDKMTLAVDGERNLEGDVVFASVQTLARCIDRMREDEFDYVIVDEFHHAEAPSYRSVLASLRPSFMLGLTATPERMDGADLLSLCDNNVLHICDLVDGIKRGLLSPFRYRGVRDVVDYEDIPFKNGTFDATALNAAVSTDERARLAFEEWKASNAKTFIGFCTDVAHADFMASWFNDLGVKATAVHSGPSSAGRAESLERLRLGQLDILFSVDMFTEGLDIPHIDGVLMLRPTESPIVFLQQLGRGLRKNDGKVLQVIDLVANHKTFLRKAIMLAEALCKRPLNAMAAVKFLTETIDLPEGVTLDLGEVNDILEALAHRGGSDEFTRWANDWHEQYGARPRAVDGAINAHYGGRPWFEKLARTKLLDDKELIAFNRHKALLEQIDRLPPKHVFSLIGLRAFIRIDLADMESVAASAHDLMLKSAELRSHLAGVTRFDWTKPDIAQRTEFWQTLLFETPGKGLLTILELVGNQVRWRISPSAPEIIHAMIEEVLDAKLWQVSSNRKPVFRDDDGREIQSHFEVTPDGTDWQVTLEARGGTKGAEGQWNLHYDQGYHLLLYRLSKANARLLDAYIDSKTVQTLPITKRRLVRDDKLPLDMASVVDVDSLRKELSRAASRVRTDNNAKGGGNRQKRVSLRVSVPDFTSTRDFEQYLSFGH